MMGGRKREASVGVDGKAEWSPGVVCWRAYLVIYTFFG